MVLFWKDVAPAPLSRVRPSFEPTDPNSYNWRKYEPALAEAKRRGWTVLLTISGPVPIWASNGATSETYDPRPHEFQAFVTATARRLGQYVSRYSIYNEPNHPKFLTPQYDASRAPVSPRLYRGLYAAALRGFAAAGSVKPVLMGETAPRGTREALPPLLFLRETLCLTPAYQRRGGCEPLPTDGWATHPYTGQTPFLKRKRVPKDDVTIGTLSRLTTALDRAASAGVVSRGLPVYLTEFGMQSLPDPLGVDLQKQAEFRAISEQIAWKNPRVAWFAQYLLRDDLPRKGRKADRFGGFETGLRQSGGTLKPAFSGFRLPLVVRRRGGKVALWGMVRPGQGARVVRIEARNGGGPWRAAGSATTGVNGYWQAQSSYRKHRTWRVRWRSASGETFAGPPTRAYR